MQILAISVYNAAGDRRDVEFETDALNIVSGDAQTGKTSLLDIVEYCLGRSAPQVPFGAITKTVRWYAVLLQFPTTRVIAARPSPEPGSRTQDRAMFVVGADLAPLDGAELRANTDRKTLRAELGRLLGIDEVVVGSGAERAPDSPADGLRPNVAHAATMCLQAQSEIANRSLLFHRNDEERIRLALRDTLPYFVGAVAADQVARRQQLADARRALRAAEASLAAAERAGQARDNRLQELVEEAFGAGLLTRADFPDREQAVRALQDAAHLRTAPAGGGDTDALLLRRDTLRRRLRGVNEQRRLLDEHVVAGEEYAGGLRVQRGRLTSLGLVPRVEDGADADRCPLCEGGLSQPDPTVEALRRSAQEVDRQLADVEAGQPRRAAALAALGRDANALREQVIAVEAALGQLAAPEQGGGGLEEAAFRRGRIDAMLGQLSDGGAARRAAAAAAVEAARQRVEDLADTLDSDEEQSQVSSRLRVISDTMSALATELGLEHEGSPVRLEGRQLTVVVDTDDGPVPLQRIGSGANWMGYHVVAHLALHQYFVEKARPVPRFLMLDQPTQAYYPPGTGQVRIDREGLPEDADSEAVRGLFRLLRRFAEDDARGLQIIVCEHAMLDESWYVDRVRHVWRDGRALIPAEWLTAAAEADGAVEEV